MDGTDVNVVSISRLATAARDRLAGSPGAIIDVSSMLSRLVENGSNVIGCTASKTGILGLTGALADAFGEQGIRVNAIFPASLAAEFIAAKEPPVDGSRGVGSTVRDRQAGNAPHRR